jgi:XTP/dITP diphosphohydrolase
LLLATTNLNKVREIVGLLAGAPIDVVTLANLPSIPAPEENGATFAENARLKALYYAGAAGMMTVAEDSGLEIDALDGAPGVESARFGGVDRPYGMKFPLIYNALGPRGPVPPAARFVCALALVRDGTVIFQSTGVVNGEIAPEPSGAAGFGYDPIFYYPPLGCTFAEAGEKKSAVSHRGQAFRALREFLTNPRPIMR